MTTIKALKEYFGNPAPQYAPVSMTELKELKAAITQAEWDQMGRDCCAELGVEWLKAPGVKATA